MTDKDREYINDIFVYSEKIAVRVDTHDVDTYLADENVYYAVERLVTIVGEAASRVSPECRALMPDVPWRKLSDVRNKLMHDYGRTDRRLVYLIAKHNIPDAVLILREELAKLPN
jgi:uncharacterized protein with HEPN domain